jgi:hypothetical protein
MAKESGRLRGHHDEPTPHAGRRLDDGADDDGDVREQDLER